MWHSCTPIKDPEGREIGVGCIGVDSVPYKHLHEVIVLGCPGRPILGQHCCSVDQIPREVEGRQKGREECNMGAWVWSAGHRKHSISKNISMNGAHGLGEDSFATNDLVLRSPL